MPIDSPKTFLATKGFDLEIHFGKAFGGQAGVPGALMAGRVSDWLAVYQMEQSWS